MEKDKALTDELIKALEENGEISISDGRKELFIQSIDDKEGYSYVSSTNLEFCDSREAVEWMLEEVKQ